MSQIGSLSKISKDLIDYSSYEHDIFSNYLEPQQNDLFDTRRFSLQNVKLEDLKTATPKMERNSSPARFLRKFSVRANSAKLISKSLYKGNGEAVASQGKLVKKVENLEKKQELWKERANVWEKERKHYQKAITSVSVYIVYLRAFSLL